MLNPQPLPPLPHNPRAKVKSLPSLPYNPRVQSFINLDGGLNNPMSSREYEMRIRPVTIPIQDEPIRPRTIDIDFEEVDKAVRSNQQTKVNDGDYQAAQDYYRQANTGYNDYFTGDVGSTPRPSSSTQTPRIGYWDNISSRVGQQFREDWIDNPKDIWNLWTNQEYWDNHKLRQSSKWNQVASTFADVDNAVKYGSKWKAAQEGLGALANSRIGKTIMGGLGPAFDIVEVPLGMMAGESMGEAVATAAGSTIGATVGNAILPFVGAIPGAIAGDLLAGKAYRTIAGNKQPSTYSQNVNKIIQDRRMMSDDMALQSSIDKRQREKEYQQLMIQNSLEGMSGLY